MKRRTLLPLLCLLSCVMMLALWQPTSSASNSGDAHAPAPREITGTVVGISGQFAGRSRPFTLIINHYTSPDEVQRLNSALQAGGQDQLLDVLSKMNAGRIVIGTGVGVTANAIIPTQQERGTKITVLYQRNVNFYELRYGTRSEDYKFGYAEIYLDRSGANNEGTFIPAAKVRLRDGNTWEVEDFGAFPARLMGLQMRGGNAAR